MKAVLMTMIGSLKHLILPLKLCYEKAHFVLKLIGSVQVRDEVPLVYAAQDEPADNTPGVLCS